MRTVTPVCLLVLSSLSGTPSIVQAAGGQQPERLQPIQELIRTEVVYPQERSEFQLTVGGTFEQARAGIRSASQSVSDVQGLSECR